jgi:hypothetical protein
MLVNAALTTRWRGNHRHLAAPWRTGRRAASVLPSYSDCGRGMSEERGPRDRSDPPGDAAGRARGPMTAERNRLSRSESPGPRSKTRPTSGFVAFPRSAMTILIVSSLSRYPARAMRCAGWYNHVLRHHHVLGRDRDPRPVHAVTTATGEEARYGRDVHPVTETTGRRSCDASGDTGLPAAGSPAVGVLTRCTLAGRGLGSGPPPPPRTTRRGPWRHPSRSRAISRLR